jgi:hypothetical protein
MTFNLQFFCLIGLACLAAMFAYSRASPRDEAVQRLALFQGVKRAWGESEASLKRRAVALARWPHTRLQPEVAWWATVLTRIRGRSPL